MRVGSAGVCFLSKGCLVAGLLLWGAPAAVGQDVYFSQPLAGRLHTSPAFTGLLDDYGVTLGFRNQFPYLGGSFRTTQLGADLRLNSKGQHHAVGLLVNQDRTGALNYTRFEAGALYAYHTRLTKQVAFSGGVRATYGRQTVAYNFLFGDQIADDGTLLGPSAEPAGFPPANYLSVASGVLFYTGQAWLSLAGHHLNQPNIGFKKQSQLPALLSLSGGYKFFAVKPGQGRATREVSLTPVGAYTRQGGSQRTEAGLYFIASPVTLAAVYRNILTPGSVNAQQVLVTTAGISSGIFRLGYSYDIGLSELSRNLGGAHEVTLSIRSFDRLESARRRLKRRDYPVAPCPAF
jgi:type IX secretion system PorP/SprF family membrane protein